MPDISEYLKLLAGLLAIVDPIGTIPIYLGMTRHNTLDERRQIALTASISFAIILIVSLFLGEQLLEAFGIGIPSFRTAGGVLIFTMGLSMLQAHESGAKQTEEERAESVVKESVAVVPLAIPLLAGPGAISTVIVYAHSDNSWLHYGLMSSVILTVAILIFIALRIAPLIGARLGKTGMNIVTRIMGLITLAIAIEFIAAGLTALFPGLAR